MVRTQVVLLALSLNWVWALGIILTRLTKSSADSLVPFMSSVEFLLLVPTPPWEEEYQTRFWLAAEVVQRLAPALEKAVPTLAGLVFEAPAAPTVRVCTKPAPLEVYCQRLPAAVSTFCM